MRRGYSRRHWKRVQNLGTGNPSATTAEKIATWQALAAKCRAEGREDAAQVCEQLISDALANR